MVTRAPRTLSFAILVALLSAIAISPQAHAATVTTWEQLRDALAAGGVITVGADISGDGVVASETNPVTLDLAGHNVTLTGGPALNINGSANVTLRDTAGTGSLTAIGTDLNAAAIGTAYAPSNSGVSPGTLTIDGAHVTATVGSTATFGQYQRGAAVGGGRYAAGLTLTVNSGSLTATSDVHGIAAAIGGGESGDSGKIVINGGTVTASVGIMTAGSFLVTNSSGAAIGSGINADADVSINGGTVSAVSTAGRGAAIGAGAGGKGVVRINGGDVTAQGSGTGAAIGSGFADPSSTTATGGNITITGGTVTAHNTGFGAALGSGRYRPGGDITISGGVIDLLAPSHASTIGAGSYDRDAPLGGDSDADSAPQQPAATRGTVTIMGTALADNPNTVAGRQAAVFNTAAPTQPIRFSLANGQGTGELVWTTIGFGHAVSFEANGGSATADQLISPGDKAAAPANPTRKDYLFTGWYNGTSQYNFASPVTADLTLTAGWDCEPCTVSFDSQGGSSVAAQAVTRGSVASTPTAPTRTGYTFTGWFNGTHKYDFASPVTDPIALTAGWDLNSYGVTFDSKGGTAVAAQSVTHGSKVSQPKAPSRPGYVFRGWTHGGSQYNFNTTVTGPLTLTATWTKAANLIDVSGNKNSKHYTQFHREIQWLADAGITRGWAVGAGKHEFRPKDNITREAMAAFMYRYAGSPAVKLPAKSPFADVTPQSTNFYKEIVWMNQQGISTGWHVSGGNKEFRPKDEITRDAMAAFMYRFAGKPVTTPPATTPFADVPKSSQFYKEITWLSSAGISTGWTQPKGKPQYRPYDEISREAMAAFLFRLDRL